MREFRNAGIQNAGIELKINNYFAISPFRYFILVTIL